MSILITGGAGFLGRQLVRHLLETECELIVVLDKDIHDDPGEPAGRAERIRGDVLDLPLLVDAIDRWRVERIVHLAYVLETPETGVRGQIETNVMGATNVFEAARLAGVSRVVYMSSAYVYPHRRELGGHRYSEDDSPSPDGVYGACKVLNEDVAGQYAAVYGLDPIGLRFTAVFGPGRSERPGIAPADHNVLPELALRGRSVVMPPDEQLSDWMYVADAVEVVRLALRAGSLEHRVFNVASECRPVGEVTRFLRELLPSADIRVGREPVVMPSLMSTDRLWRELGFTPKYSVEEGLVEYLEAVTSERS